MAGGRGVVRLCGAGRVFGGAGHFIGGRSGSTLCRFGRCGSVSGFFGYPRVLVEVLVTLVWWLFYVFLG